MRFRENFKNSWLFSYDNVVGPGLPGLCGSDEDLIFC